MLCGAGVGLPAGDGHCVAVLQSLREQEECAGGQNVAHQAQLPRYAPMTLCMSSCFLVSIQVEDQCMVCCNDARRATPPPPSTPSPHVPPSIVMSAGYSQPAQAFCSCPQLPVFVLPRAAQDHLAELQTSQKEPQNSLPVAGTW